MSNNTTPIPGDLSSLTIPNDNFACSLFQSPAISASIPNSFNSSNAMNSVLGRNEDIFSPDDSLFTTGGSLSSRSPNSVFILETTAVSGSISVPFSLGNLFEHLNPNIVLDVIKMVKDEKKPVKKGAIWKLPAGYKVWDKLTLVQKETLVKYFKALDMSTQQGVLTKARSMMHTNHENEPTNINATKHDKVYFLSN